MSKYTRTLKGQQIDVYDVLKAFNVTCPALQHLIKKALCCGLRGHKDQAEDLQDIVDSAVRAQELSKNNESVVKTKSYMPFRTGVLPTQPSSIFMSIGENK